MGSDLRPPSSRILVYVTKRDRNVKTLGGKQKVWGGGKWKYWRIISHLWSFSPYSSSLFKRPERVENTQDSRSRRTCCKFEIYDLLVMRFQVSSPSRSSFLPLGNNICSALLQDGCVDERVNGCVFQWSIAHEKPLQNLDQLRSAGQFFYCA